MLVRPKTKMLHTLPRILRPPQQHTIPPRRRPQRQLIQRQTLPPGFLNSRSGRGGEAQGRDGEFGDGEKAGIVSYGADYDEDFGGGGGVGGVGCEAGEGEGGAVDAGGEEAAEEDAVEGRGGAACLNAM